MYNKNIENFPISINKKKLKSYENNSNDINKDDYVIDIDNDNDIDIEIDTENNEINSEIVKDNNKMNINNNVIEINPISNSRFSIGSASLNSLTQKYNDVTSDLFINFYDIEPKKIDKIIDFCVTPHYIILII